MQVRTQRRVLQRLQIVVHGRLAVVTAVRHVLQEDLDLLYWDDVADVLRRLQVTKGETDDLVTNYGRAAAVSDEIVRSEEHTSELQSQSNLVCRLLLEKKKKKIKKKN